MKVKLISHREEWLPVDLQPPPGDPEVKRHGHISLWHYEMHRDRNVQVGKLSGHSGGTAVWNLEGELLFAAPNVLDATIWGNDLLCVERGTGACRHAWPHHFPDEAQGVPHVITRRSLDGSRVVDQSDICVPTGAAGRIVLDPVTGDCLVTFLDQNESGYVIYDPRTRTQLAPFLFWESPTLSPPAFAPGQGIVVRCQYLRTDWWTDEIEDEPLPSEGGQWKVGDITVHHLATNQISVHALLVDLPPGWLPDRPDHGDWMAVWGPEFVDTNRFRIWWPDDSSDVLSLPLPKQVVLDRALGTTRIWLD